MVLLSAEHGIGKSRMVRALRERPAGETYPPLTHHCLPYHTNTALYPVASMLRRTSGLAAGDSPLEQREKLERLVSRSHRARADVVPLLAALLKIPPAGRYQKPLPTELVQQIIARADGVPLFIEELTKVVLESTLIRDCGDRFEPLPPGGR